jgi:hypothetical protein
MNDHREDLIKPHNEIDNARKRTASRRFISITRAFFASAASRELECPRCGTPLDFTNAMEWIGPDSFICHRCDQLINIRLIQKALRDLGVI